MNIKELVYSQSYSMDEASSRVFKEAGVLMRQIELAD
jgi:dCMP deaminase